MYWTGVDGEAGPARGAASRGRKIGGRGAWTPLLRLHPEPDGAWSPDEEGRPGGGIPFGRIAGELCIRATNVLVAATALLLLSPLMALIALAIRLESSGSVIYRQLRVGLDRRNGRDRESTGRRTMDLGGRPFMVYKFRTMREDAERATGPVWAAGGEDDRVTRVGRLLRRHRLDELPQLWNVLRGDMSVVGPRPERPAFVAYLREEIEAYPLRQKVRPGITGWAQVHREADRTLEDVRDKLRYDLEYLERRSLWMDLRIMARTLPVMASPEEAVGGDGRGTRGATGPADAARANGNGNGSIGPEANGRSGTRTGGRTTTAPARRHVAT